MLESGIGWKRCLTASTKDVDLLSLKRRDSPRIAPALQLAIAFGGCASTLNADSAWKGFLKRALRIVLVLVVSLLAQGGRAEAAANAGAPEGPRPGDGCPGRLEPYAESPELKARMSRYGMTAGWYRRDPLPATTNVIPWADGCLVNELPYLLVSPKHGRRPVPMVVYFGGTGEHGTNLVLQFNQPVVFDRLSSPAFQSENPSYVFAPMLPKGGVVRHAMPVGSSPLADLVCDAMFAVVASLKDPPVDTNRLYLTGLSWGGVAAFELSCGYPGRFAAAVPVSCIQTPLRIPPDKPGNYWMFHNETSFRSKGSRWAIREMARIVRSGGGDFRCSTFPDGGHDAWRKAWQEDATWAWMFSRTADGKPVRRVRSVRGRMSDPVSRMGVACSASVSGVDERHRPEHGADGLDATCYISARPVVRGDWWMAEFPEPVSGRVTLFTGTKDGDGRLSSGRVETSRDGHRWSRAGAVARKTGAAAFDVRSGVRFFRLLPEPSHPEVLTVREIRIHGH